MLNLAKNQSWSEGQSFISGCRQNNHFLANSASAVLFTWTDIHNHNRFRYFTKAIQDCNNDYKDAGCQGYRIPWLQVALATDMKVPDLKDVSRQDDVGTQRTLGVQALLDTVVCLGQGHGERSLGVHLHNNNQCCLTLLLKWTCYCNQIWLETLQHYQQLLKEKYTSIIKNCNPFFARSSSPTLR